MYAVRDMPMDSGTTDKSTVAPDGISLRSAYREARLQLALHESMSPFTSLAQCYLDLSKVQILFGIILYKTKFYNALIDLRSLLVSK